MLHDGQPQMYLGLPLGSQDQGRTHVYLEELGYCGLPEQFKGQLESIEACQNGRISGHPSAYVAHGLPEAKSPTAMQAPGMVRSMASAA